MPTQFETPLTLPEEVVLQKEEKKDAVMKEPQPRKVITNLQEAFHFTDLQSNKPTRAEDPYEYQYGFGNRHQSEVLPGTLPVAQNNPQLPRFNLYTEGLTSSAFTAPRTVNASTYMYRCRPSVANRKPMELYF
jgi:homogentisate 1,2-dioxygenase